LNKEEEEEEEPAAGTSVFLFLMKILSFFIKEIGKSVDYFFSKLNLQFFLLNFA
jgi:hypothetical protein